VLQLLISSTSVINSDSDVPMLGSTMPSTTTVIVAIATIGVVVVTACVGPSWPCSTVGPDLH
jgi:hypothetical protein